MINKIARNFLYLALLFIVLTALSCSSTKRGSKRKKCDCPKWSYHIEDKANINQTDLFNHFEKHI
jgi:hypothetical protein